MHISNHEFVDQLHTIMNEDFIRIFSLVEKLMELGEKNWIHGTITHDKEKAKEKIQSLANMLTENTDDSMQILTWLVIINILQHYEKSNPKDMKEIIEIIKEEYPHKKSFTLFQWIQTDWPKEKEIGQFVQEKFDADMTNEQYDKVWVRLQWEWLYYERSVEQDLKKLLK